MAYQQRGDLIIVRSSGEGRSGVRFTINGQERAQGDLPAKECILPRTLLVYTSGNVDEWRSLITPDLADDEEIEGQAFDLDQLRLDEEQAPGYIDKELEAAADVDGDDAADPGDTAALSLGRAFLVEPEQLRLGLLAALLDFQMSPLPLSDDKQAFADVLDQVRIKLIGFSLEIDPEKLPVSP